MGDYTDRFSLRTDQCTSAEGWARAMFGDVPSLVEQFIWRGLLGLRLNRGRSPATVGGWRIDGRGHDWVRLVAAGPLLHAELVVETRDSCVALVTTLHYDRAPARLLWPPLSIVHRALVPMVLRDADARIRRRGR